MKRIIGLLAASFLACVPLFALTEELSGAYNFRIEFVGIKAGAFQEVSGLSAEIEIIEYQDGEDPTLRKRPGRTTYANVTLKRGYLGRGPILDWFEQITMGTTTRRNVIITLEDKEGFALGSWNLTDCWPRAWKVEGVQTGGMTLVEEIQLVVEKVTFTPAP